MLLAAFFFTTLSTCTGLKILAVLPFPMKSHQMLFNALLGELLERRHDVTVYSTTPIHTNVSNYKHVYVTSKLEHSLEKKYFFDQIKPKLDLEAFIRPMGFQQLTSDLSEEVMIQPQMQELIKSNEKFDVIILETFFGQEAFVGFGHKFNAPIVTLATFGSFSFLDSVLGNPNPLAYLATYQLAFTTDLTFYQKLKNVVATVSELHYSYFQHLPKQQAVYEKHFSSSGGSPLPKLLDLLKNIAVVLMCTQPELSYARPYLPNMISVGGFHIKEHRKALPQAIQKFIDGADDGFIYFSLGSTFSGGSMPAFIRDAFVTAFRSIRQRVIWKIDMLPADLPPNVITSDWIQQNDVLADPKCRAFITHGGLLSLIEATHFAVPLIGVPVFADQPHNMVKAEHAQIGIRLRVLNISVESVSWALNEILHNPKYKTNILQLSSQMRDTLVSPMETAVYWIEHVAKHQGAAQLRSPARYMSYFSYLLLDVLLFILLVIVLICILLFILLRKINRIFITIFNKRRQQKSKME